MRTWEQYLESAKEEDQEEKNGLDTDHDHEAGESAKHQAKVKEAKNKMIEFFEKRKKGAAKTAAESKIKGGPAILSYWHFSAKAGPYRDVLAAIKRNENERWFKVKCNELIRKLNSHMKQQEFQKLMGQIEVYGEAMAQLWN
jgi:hypothetical protein